MPGEEGSEELPVTGEMMAGGLITYQGNQQRSTPLTALLIRKITSRAGANTQEDHSAV